ncbi:hypothetical protein ACQPXM_41205 (plasmid) [Kribbella sp. CA-253562]|uniref:hypothetical protein n=1 Tax=Kribbella sp. CA-253562 TaxID=3239942 RepID=UPI003D8AF20D
MVDDDLRALELAMQLRSGSPAAVDLPDELRLLVTAPVREAIAAILLGELAQRIRRETTTTDLQQNGYA